MDGQLVDLAVEVERHLVILVVHPCARVAPDVKALIRGYQERDRFWNRQRAHVPTVDLQYARASLCNARAVIREVEDDGVLSRRERRIAVIRPAGHEQLEEVVGEYRTA